VSPASEISLLFCDEARMRQLNRDYLAEDYPTDVLSFPQEGEALGVGPWALGARSQGPRPNAQRLLLGDIAICVPVAARQAAAAGHSLAAEVEWLLLHGALHLLGYDDATPEGLAEMIRRQHAVLAAVPGAIG
jgi:probable rRNA maturation factor